MATLTPKEKSKLQKIQQEILSAKIDLGQESLKKEYEIRKANLIKMNAEANFEKSFQQIQSKIDVAQSKLNDAVLELNEKYGNSSYNLDTGEISILIEEK